MKHRNRSFGKFVVPIVIVLCASFGFAAGPDKAAKASAEPKPAASEESQKIIFKSPADAYAQYSGTNVVAVKAAAKEYLQRIVDQSPRDPANFSAACASLINVLSQERQYDKVIQVCLNQIGSEQDTANIYAAALSLADAYIASNDQPKAEKALGDLLDKYRSPDLFPGAWAKLTALYQQQKQSDRIIQMCAKYLGKETDPKMIIPITTTLSSTYAAMGDYQNAAKVLDTYLEKNRSQVTPANIVTTVKTLSAIYVTNLGQPKEAVTMMDREIKFVSSTNTIPQQAELTIAKADIFSITLKDLPTAASEYRKVTEMSGQIPDAQFSEASLKLAQAYKEMGQKDQAVQTLLDYLKKSGAVPSSAAVQKLIDCDANEQQLMEAVWLLREKVAAQSAATTAVEQYQGDIVKLLVKAGKRQEALQEARVFLYICSDQTMPAAIELIAWIFKTTDLNLARANTFLKYQKYGAAGEDGKPGTDDDLANIIKDIPPLSDERRTKMFKDPLDNLPKDWIGYKKRGDIYLYLDQPVETFQAYRKSFELCPMSEKELQSATDSLTACAIRITRDVPLAELMVQYIMLGPAGKDCKAGTPDDLKDPTPEIIMKIQYGQQSRAVPERAAKPAEPAKPAPAPAVPAKQEESKKPEPEPEDNP